MNSAVEVLFGIGWGDDVAENVPIHLLNGSPKERCVSVTTGVGATAPGSVAMS